MTPVLPSTTALALLAALALAGTPTTSKAQNVLYGPVRVIDGDTIEIQRQRIRLHGIDAPESAQECSDARGRSYRCGQAATQALASLVRGASVNCQIRDKDRYGRLVAVCRRGGVDLNASMVRQGHALAYRQYGTDYVSHETAARTRKLGVWQGRFTMPWDWRRTQGGKSTASPAPPQGCAIKGNISASSERIYHVPGQAYYERTRISEAKGERWFCAESEARAAGWRRARR
ncbi:MAG: thermonuclease family protein [Boseongicola sp. SB0677_bin_26]|nr:thermonuclease family protein [Boseongicola sp. SB0665_bin_10]MYG26943.1 thermonuclease family protein [Boseongicola sp. SB0677_bin_26]